MRGFNFINPANNRTSGSDYAAFYEMRDKLPKSPDEDIWSRLHTKLPFPKYELIQPPLKTFYIGGYWSKSSDDISEKIRKLSEALDAYEDVKKSIDYASPKKCYYFIDRPTGEKTRIPCSLANVLKKAHEISGDPYYKDMVVIEESKELSQSENISSSSDDGDITEQDKLRNKVITSYETQKNSMKQKIKDYKNKYKKSKEMLMKTSKNTQNCKNYLRI
jgi:hypothetical protein